MEDYRIDIMIDQGPNARSVRLEIPRFTLIGATTRVGLLTAPMRSRFTLQTRLDYYDRKDLTQIVTRSCGLLKCPIDQAGAEEIATRARGTPRIANNLIHFTRDYSEERANGTIDREIAGKALELLEIDERGLDEGAARDPAAHHPDQDGAQHSIQAGDREGAEGAEKSENKDTGDKPAESENKEG